MSEQPEIIDPVQPEQSEELAQAVLAAAKPKPRIALLDAEAELLQGGEEEKSIGSDEIDKFLEPSMLQAMQTKAMLEVAQAVRDMLEQQRAIRQVPYNEIKPVSPWNPEGKRDRVKFIRETYQHGRWVNPMMVTEETITLFNQLKPGRYLDRKVEVNRNSEGAINVTWSNANPTQRMEFYRNYPSIEHVLRACIAERKLKEEKRRRGDIDDNEFIA